MDEKAIKMYQEDLMSLQQIGDHYGVSRQAVKQYLNRRGVYTGKGQWFIKCDQCGIKVFKPRCQIRGKMHKFCSPECYYKFINNPDYIANRHGQRIARYTIKEKFGLNIHEFMVVHHQDSNTLNNEVSNLVVFNSQSDHMKYHRFRPVLAFLGATGKWETIQRSK